MTIYLLTTFSSVMKSIGGVILAVVILLAMVTIHEFGHYLAGKILGFKINEFSVGFGPALFKRRSKKTGELFAVRVVPLGGYCAFDGEDEAETPQDGKDADKNGADKDGEAGADKDGRTGEPFAELSESEQGVRDAAEGSQIPEVTQKDGYRVETNGQSASEIRREAKSEEKNGESAEKESADEYPEPKGARFNDQPPWKRIIVLVAGATMNYLLALVLLMIMFVGFGRPHSYLYPVETTTEESSVERDTDGSAGDVVFASGLQAGDVVLTVNGKDLYLISDYVDALRGKKAGESVSATVYRRNGDGGREKVSIDLVLQADGTFANMSDEAAIYAVLGLDGEKCSLVSVVMKEGFFQSLGDAFVYSGKLGGTVLRSLGELLTGKMKITGMGGPVTTIAVASQAASSSAVSFFNVAGLIGVNLAVFNLLPIPALDGSKVVFCIIEWIRKKPINRKVETMIHFVGIIFLFAFAILVDVLHLFL